MTSAGRSRSGASAAASAAASVSPPVGSSRASAAPVSTWLPVATCSSLRRRQHRLHLHALEHENRRSGGHLVTHRKRRGDDECRCGRTQDAALVAADPVRDTVDLDELHRAVRRGDEAVGAPADADPAGELPDPLEVGLDRDDLPARLRHGHPEAGRAGAVDGDLVRGAAQLEVDGAPDGVRHLGAAPTGGLERAGALGFTDLFVSACSATAGLVSGIVLETAGYSTLGVK